MNPTNIGSGHLRKIPKLHGSVESDGIDDEDKPQQEQQQHTQVNSSNASLSLNFPLEINIATRLSTFFERIFSLFQNRRDFKTLISKIEDRPKGYPRVGAFVDSDPDFVIYRRFGYVRHRVLLHLQDEIASLEAILERVDQHEAEEMPRNVRIRREYENSKPVKGYKGFDTLIQLKEKIREYDELLHSTRSILAVKPPPTRNVNSYYNFVESDQSVTEDEREYLLRVPDLIHLCGGQDDTSLNGFVEKLFNSWFNDSTKSYFASEDQRQRTNIGHISLYSKSRVDVIVTVIKVFFLMQFFVISIFLLADIKLIGWYKIVVAEILTMLLTVLSSYSTNYRQHNVIVAAASYFIMVVVFL